MARCDQLAVFDSINTPPTTIAIPASLSTVSRDCTLPPNATARQLTPEKKAIAPQATSWRGPNCQSTSCPSSRKRDSSHAPPSGTNAERKMAKPVPRIAIEPLPPTKKRVQPKANAAASPYERRRYTYSPPACGSIAPSSA